MNADKETEMNGRGRTEVLVAGACVVAGVWAVGGAGAPAPTPDSKPPPPAVASRPVAERDALLDRIEARHKDIKSIAAVVECDTYGPVFRRHEARSGKITYLRPHSFRLDWTTPPPGEGLVYDGEFFWEIRNKAKQIVQWTVPKEAKEPGAPDGPAAALGPLRFLAGMKAQELKRDFDVTLIDTPDERNTHLFLLIPRKPADKQEFTQLEVWMDAKRSVPVKMRLLKPSSKNVQTWTLKDAKENDPAVTEKSFAVDIPRGWEHIKDPAGVPQPPPPPR